MKVLIDTNILISASMSFSSTPYRAYVKAVTAPYHGVVCDQNLDELRRVYNRKFPDKLAALEHFLALALPALEIVSTPAIDISEEALIRDATDRPILRAAVNSKVDIVLTGDKDFLESGIQHPKIMTASEFLQI